MVSFPVISRHTRLIGFAAALCFALIAFRQIAGDDSSPAADSTASAVVAEARAVRSTGRDTNGRLLPLYIQVRDTLWLQPLPVYLTAITATVAPAAASPSRVASAAVAALDVLLMFAAASRIFRSDRLGALAAAMLALIPAHAFAARLSVSALYPIPFVLAWLLCLVIALDDSRRTGVLFAAGLCLGCGTYADPTSVLTMPWYAAMTALALFLAGCRSSAAYLSVGAGFAMPLLLQVPWFASHPSSYVDTIGRWGVHPAFVRNPVEGLRAFVNWPSLSTRVWLFWDFFSPLYLFGTVLLLPFAVLLPAGLYALVTGEGREPIDLVLALGVVSAPLVAATFNEPRAVGRELVLLPFAVLVAIHGARFIHARPQILWRALAIGLLVAMPVQYAYLTRW